MEINTKSLSSEEKYSQELSHLFRACAGLIHVRTEEIWRTVLATRRIILSGATPAHYEEWDFTGGVKQVNAIGMYSIGESGDRRDLVGVLEDIVEKCSTPDYEDKNIVLVNPHHFWSSPPCQETLLLLANMLPTTSCRVLLVTPDMPSPESLGDGLATVYMLPPSFEELKRCAQDLVKDVEQELEVTYTEDEIRDICYAGMGMGYAAFEMHMARGLTLKENNKKKIPAKDIIDTISQGKTDILHRSDLLELYPQDDMSNVGGMENIKAWVAKRARCYTEEAAEHGITPPKGCVVVGISGTGKSLLAKCVAGQLGVSLVRLDFGRVFNSLVGASEERMRTALKHVEAMAPCVLFVDEADKGLGGIGSSGGDSGTSSRVLGCFLSWLNDNTKPVFTIMTANNIQGLPPELLRKGRFDEIFATGFPDTQNRKEILEIHLRKRGWGDAFSDQQLNLISESMKGFVGAEVESVVKDALIESFHLGEALEVKHLEAAIAETTPLSKSRPKEIAEMVTWASQCATPAGKKDFVDETNVTPLKGRSRRKLTQDT